MTSDMSAADLTAAVQAAAVAGLNLAAERVRAVAVPRTPFEYGDLSSSLTVVEATSSDLTSAVVSDLPYAVRQHEDMSLHHDDGQAKYLETAALDSISDVERIMAAALQRHLGT